MLNARQNRSIVTLRARVWIVAAIATASVSLAATDIVATPPRPLATPQVLAASMRGPLPAATIAPIATPAARDTERRAGAAEPARRARAATARPGTATPPSTAQSSAVPATMVGAVVDQTGGALPGVTMTLTPAADGVRQQTVTSADGRFAFRNLAAGSYTLVASVPGFMRISSDFTAGPGGTVDRVLMLPLGPVSEDLRVACSTTRTGRRDLSDQRGDLAAVATPTSMGAVRMGWALLTRALIPTLAAAPQDVRPVRVGGDVRPPRKITDVRPTCPPGSAPRVDTAVRMVARIGVDGTVRDVTYVAAPRDAAPAGALVDAAVAAVRQWVYTPALLNGKPQDIQMAIAVVYEP